MDKPAIPSPDIYKFRFRLRALNNFDVPEYKGSLFRGAFAWAYKKSICVTKYENCGGCILKTSCSYFQLFETEIDNTNIAQLKGVKKTPHPFVMHPPKDFCRKYEKDQMFNIEVTFFSDSIKMITTFIYVFRQLGLNGISNRSKFEVVDVLSIDEFGKEEIFYDGTADAFLGIPKRITSDDIFKFAAFTPAEVTIRFVTPYRVQENGIILVKPEEVTPLVIFKSTERRCLSIAGLYSEESNAEPSLYDCKEVNVIGNKLKFYDWERTSNRQKRTMSLGGFLGEITLGGNLSIIFPYLLLGTYLNIGKNTVFGLGEYNLIELYT